MATASLKKTHLAHANFLPRLIVALTAHLALPGPAQAESAEVCRQYAQAAVDAFRENQTRGCRFADQRWQGDFDNHLNWCLGAPTQWVKNEREFRTNLLRVCRREPQAVVCKVYAANAVGDERSNVSNRCGFAGGRWQLNHDEHLRWCLQTPPDAVNRETGVRDALLNVCGRQQNHVRCDQYARRAAAQVAEGSARGCNFSGPRWTPSYEDHLTWCVGQPAEAAESERRNREGPLSQCRTNNPLPGGSQNGGSAYKRCAADCAACNREGLRCTASAECQEKYPTTAPWLCY